jgi:hypothetical protein
MRNGPPHVNFTGPADEEGFRVVIEIGFRKRQRT